MFSSRLFLLSGYWIAEDSKESPAATYFLPACFNSSTSVVTSTKEFVVDILFMKS